MSCQLLNDYILKLGNDTYKVLGVWEQGSKVYGYGDTFSDEDYVVVWENGYPKKGSRETLLRQCKVAQIKAKDHTNKASDKFSAENVTYNVVHLTGNDDFFELFKEINSAPANEDHLYRLGGFIRANILYDPQRKLKNYKDTVKVTSEILQNYKESRKSTIKNNIEWLRTSAKRKHTVDCIKCLNFLLVTLIIIQYLENNQFPIPVKWFEKESEKFGWQETNIFKVVSTIKERVPFEDIIKYFS